MLPPFGEGWGGALGGLGRGLSALATPTELPRVRTACYGLTIHGRWERAIHIGLLITNALINTGNDEGG